MVVKRVIIAFFLLPACSSVCEPPYDDGMRRLGEGAACDPRELGRTEVCRGMLTCCMTPGNDELRCAEREACRLSEPGEPCVESSDCVGSFSCSNGQYVCECSPHCEDFDHDWDEPVPVPCMTDRETCEYNCCAGFETCRDGECVCRTDCVPLEPTECIIDRSDCFFECCTLTETCRETGCECEPECAVGTEMCFLSMGGCQWGCCGDDEACLSDGCAECHFSCEDVTLVDSQVFELSIDWTEQSDDISAYCVEACAQTEGFDALYSVVVRAGAAVLVELDEGTSSSAVHVLDRCPPTSCLATEASAVGRITRMANRTRESARVFVMLERESYARNTEGRILVSPTSGNTCEEAMDAPSPYTGFLWTGNAPPFSGPGSGGGLCERGSGSDLWFRVEVEAAGWLGVDAAGPEIPPSIAVGLGECGALECVASGAGHLSVRNASTEPRPFYVAIGWPTSYGGAIEVVFSDE